MNKKIYFAESTRGFSLQGEIVIVKIAIYQ